jgi:transposase
MASARSQHNSGVEVIEISDQEYEKAVRDALRELGLTYAQLRAQARKGDFQSARARRLWLTIGNPAGA